MYFPDLNLIQQMAGFWDFSLNKKKTSQIWKLIPVIPVWELLVLIDIFYLVLIGIF